MSLTADRRLPTLLFVVSIAAYLTAIAMVVTDFSSPEDMESVIPFVTLLLLWGALGLLLASRVPTNPVGWLLCVMALVTELSFLIEVYAESSGAGSEYAAWFDSWFADWAPPALVVWLLLLFPSGRLSGRIDRAIGVGAIAICALGAAALALSPGLLDVYDDVINPFGVDGLESITSVITSVAGVGLAVVFLLTIGSMVLRFRRSQGIERQQLKWFFLAAGVLVFDLVLGNFATALGLDSGIGNTIGGVLFFLGLAGLALGITVAVLRYRLYDIDRLINRALVYAALTASVVLLYVGLVFGLQAILDPVVGDSQLVVAASTLAVAAAVRPLGARIQRFIDRRFYRRKYDASRTVEEMRRRLRDHVAIDAVDRCPHRGPGHRPTRTRLTLDESKRYDHVTLATIWLRNDA